MSRQWRELCEQRPDLYLYQPSEEDLRAMRPELVEQWLDEIEWLADSPAQIEYQSWLDILAAERSTT